MRKTVLVLFLALVLTVPFAAAEAGEQEFLGIWYGTQVGMWETMLPISMMGIEATMDIREDGTVLMSSNGEETNGTWTPGEPGTIVIDDGETPQAAALADGKLSVEAEGFVLVFEREPAAAAALAEVSTDATAEDFFGAWVGAEMNMAGVGMPMAGFGIEARIELNADGQALFTMLSEGDGGTVTTDWAMDGYMASVTVEGVATPMTLRGGRLVMEAEEGVFLIFDREA